ncbi:Cilia- and flagella-associated protein 52 [Terramyces sp. JEL0728]|nr:Cilia- and flagella-associated protein 52 [Terramyces sp. JEL0728]
MATEGDVQQLSIKSIIGFGGNVPGGLLKHPNGTHQVYSLGSTVVVSDGKKSSQEFLQGHTNVVTCIAISKCGKYIASGQVTHMGFQADIILWDFEKRTLIKRLSLHKVKVQALAFSPSGKYLASLGGEDDNAIIIWDMEQYAAICGSPASTDSSGVTLSLAYLNKNDTQFVTGGVGTLRVWELNAEKRKVRATDCQTGQIKRIVKCIAVDENDEYMYCGTTTGDLQQVSLHSKLFKKAGPPKEKDLFSMGILSTAISPKSDSVIVGSGDGTIAVLGLPNLNIQKESSDIFATASDSDIRLWNANTKDELLRISVPNLECQCITFKKDGSSLITGWNDGKIRAFGPQSGRLQYVINDAHKRVVTALAVTDAYNSRGDFRIVSGGEDGQVRVWKISKQTQQLDHAMKEHKGTVTCIKIRKNGYECVSSSSDGSCIIWDLTRYVRNQVLFAPSFFHACCYYPDESQLLTSGTDRKVAYWEAFDGSLIREIQASQSDSINGLDITADGKLFVIGGSDKIVKAYRYEEGELHAVGVGHSTDITKVRISPNDNIVVSVSSEGAIFEWQMPKV